MGLMPAVGLTPEQWQEAEVAQLAELELTGVAELEPDRNLG